MDDIPGDLLGVDADADFIDGFREGVDVDVDDIGCCATGLTEARGV